MSKALSLAWGSREVGNTFRRRGSWEVLHCWGQALEGTVGHPSLPFSLFPCHEDKGSCHSVMPLDQAPAVTGRGPKLPKL